MQQLCQAVHHGDGIPHKRKLVKFPQSRYFILKFHCIREENPSVAVKATKRFKFTNTGVIFLSFVITKTTLVHNTDGTSASIRNHYYTTDRNRHTLAKAFTSLWNVAVIGNVTAIQLRGRDFC